MKTTQRSARGRAKIRTAVFSAGIVAGALVGPGLAQADYPPVPQPPKPPTIDVSGPGVGSNVPSSGGSLPSTGNSDIAPSLMIAAGALLAGLAITGATAVSRRRHDDETGVSVTAS